MPRYIIKPAGDGFIVERNGRPERAGRPFATREEALAYVRQCQDDDADRARDDAGPDPVHAREGRYE